MTAPWTWLRAFCRLVASDGLCESSILQTQLRHARNLTTFISERATPAPQRLYDHDVVLGLLEVQIQHKLKPYLNAALKVVDTEWDHAPAATFARFIELRAKAEVIEEEVHANVRRLTRSIRQAAYVHPTEFPPLSLFFGLEQAKITERVDGIARDYQKQLLRAVGSSPGSRKFSHGTLALSYEYIGTSNHSHSERLRSDALELSTQVSVPIWLLYTPRYLPTICHELAHPFAGELLGSDGPLQRAALAFRSRSEDVIERHMGRAALHTIPNISAAIARELLTDVLSLRAAGPSYAVAWHASTLGRGPIGPRQHLVLPTCVRLRLLADIARAHLPEPLAAVLDQDTALYREILDSRRYLEKARFQEALHDVCRDLVQAFEEALPAPVPASPAWGPATAAMAEVFDRDELAGAGRKIFDEANVDAAWTGDVLRSVPGFLWHAHLLAARDGVAKMPEGRILHMLHAPEWAGWKENEYSEWLWLKRIMKSTRHSFRSWWKDETSAQGPLVADVIGAYNFVSIREPFRARDFDGYPPRATPEQPFHATRQILVRLARQGQAPVRPLREGFAQGQPLVIIEIHAAPDATLPPDLLDFVTQAREGICPLAVFKSLGNGDVVLVAQFERAEQVARLLDEIKPKMSRIRTLSSILLPGSSLAADVATPSMTSANVRGFLRFREEPAEAWWTDAGIDKERVERVLGGDDAEVSFAIRSSGDFEKVLTIADNLALSGALGTFDARVGFASWPP